VLVFKLEGVVGVGVDAEFSGVEDCEGEIGGGGELAKFNL